MGDHRPTQTSFIGRAEELEALCRRFAAGARLVTVVGPPGAGKTRLARAYLAHAEAEGLFCDLVAARDAADVERLVAAALGLQVAEPGAVAAALSCCGDRLLVLDNFEQLLPAAQETVGAWLDAAPGLRLLVTSRAPLGLEAEWCQPLAGLDPGAAATLFVERAAQRGARLAPDDTVAQLVARLDHLPLAIELAAARSRTLPPPALLAALDRRFELLRSEAPDRPARQRSLEAALAWSWQLLGPDEQRALAALSLFAGPFEAAAAVSVLGPGGLALLERLVSRSWVAAGSDDELVLLESIRAWGTERLDDEARAEAAVAHARWYVERGLAARAALLGPQPAAAVASLRRDEQQLLAAWERMRRLQPALAVGAALALDALLALQGPWEQLHAQLLDGALALAEADPIARSKVLQAMARVRALRGFNAEALAAADGALAAAGDDPTERARSLGLRSFALRQLGRCDEAIAAVREALELPNRELRALHLGVLAAALSEAGRLDEAVPVYQEAIALQHAVGMRRAEALATGNLGIVRSHQGRLDEAERLLRTALAGMDEVGDRMIAARMRWQLATWLAAAGRRNEADHELRRAESLARSLGERELLAYCLCTRATIEPEQAVPLLDEAERWALPLGEKLLAHVREARKGAARELRLAPDASWFVVGGSRVELARRPSLRRILARLADERERAPGHALDVYALLDAGWPGEQVHPESGSQRVWTAVRTLRRLGLEGVLASRDGGYAIDPGVVVLRQG